MLDLNYFLKNPHTELTEKISDFNNFKINHPMVQSIIHIDYDIDLDWQPLIQCIEVKGVINFTLECLDVFTGNTSQYSDSIDWNEYYSFDKIKDVESTLILDNCFDLQNYLIQQINVNLPYNLINNSDIIKKYDLKGIFLTQEEYIEQNQNNLDPRWKELAKSKNK